MGLFTGITLNTMRDLLVDQLQDLYDAEQRLVSALPRMADAASSPSLQSAFREHLEQTQGQVTRLEQAFRILGEEAKTKTCAAMKGLISEGEEVISADGDPDVKDAALIAAAQRVEHYEIAAYGSARTFARCEGATDVAELLQATLDEEGDTDKRLTALAEGSINARAEAPSSI